jgi:transketolase
MRKQIINMIVKATASHIGSSYSIVELLVYLYEKVLQIDPKSPSGIHQDKFILSKGWGVSALYSILAYKGFFDKKLLETYCENGSKMIGMATRNDIPGVEASTGSIGHGLPIGAGIAMAMKMNNSNKRVYVLMGDGGCDEGVIWETALIAAHHHLNNLIGIIDYNKWQSFGRISGVLGLEPLKQKWEAFNWNVIEIDGHNFQEIEDAIQFSHESKVKPTMIIAHTVKGKGLSIIEDKNEYHYRTPREAELAVAQKEGLI